MNIKILSFLLSLFKIQAYDSVWREALYAKLKQIGFGGKTLSIIKSMYHNDCIKFLINGHYTAPLWLTQGVKLGKIVNVDHDRLQLVNHYL